MSKIDVLDVKNFIDMCMDEEWEKLPEGDADYESGRVVLGNPQYTALIRYRTLEMVLNYIEKNM